MVITWWRHDMERLFVLLDLCEGNLPVTSGSPSHWASNAEVWCFFGCSPEKVELPVTCDVMTLIWHHCNWCIVFKIIGHWRRCTGKWNLLHKPTNTLLAESGTNPDLDMAKRPLVASRFALCYFLFSVPSKVLNSPMSRLNFSVHNFSSSFEWGIEININSLNIIGTWPSRAFEKYHWRDGK